MAPSPLVSNWEEQREIKRRLAKDTTISLYHSHFLTSLNASFSSFTPIMSAVSARSFGPINSTKSSKSTCPPTSEKQKGCDTIKRACTCKVHEWQYMFYYVNETAMFPTCLQFMLICWLSSINSISVGIYPMVLIQFPRSLHPMKPSLSLSNSWNASRNSMEC